MPLENFTTLLCNSLSNEEIITRVNECYRFVSISVRFVYELWRWRDVSSVRPLFKSKKRSLYKWWKRVRFWTKLRKLYATNFQLASKSNGASWFESKNDGIVTGMYYSRWFLKSTLFFKIHRNSKGNIIVYTDRIDADSRYYIFHREILYHAKKEIKFIFKRKKYQLLLFLFFIIQWGIRIDRWSDMQPTYPLETNLGDFLRVFYVPESQDFYALSLSFETLIILLDISRKGCI